MDSSSLHRLLNNRSIHHHASSSSTMSSRGEDITLVALLVVLAVLVLVFKLVDMFEERAERRRGQNSNPLRDVAEDWTKDECSICLAGFDKVAVLKPCNHVFHADCISKWLPKNRSCPVCRQDKPRLALCTLQIKSPINDSGLDIV